MCIESSFCATHTLKFINFQREIIYGYLFINEMFDYKHHDKSVLLPFSRCHQVLIKVAYNDYFSNTVNNTLSQEVSDSNFYSPMDICCSLDSIIKQNLVY